MHLLTDKMKLILQAEILNIVANVFLGSKFATCLVVCKRFVTKNAINLVSVFDTIVSQQFKSKMFL